MTKFVYQFLVNSSGHLRKLDGKKNLGKDKNGGEKKWEFLERKEKK